MTPQLKTPPEPPPAWRPRFSLGTLMLVLLVCCFTAAAGRYLVQGLAAGASGRAYFVITVLVLPMLVLLAMQVFYRLSRSLRPGRRSRRNRQ